MKRTLLNIKFQIADSPYGDVAYNSPYEHYRIIAMNGKYYLQKLCNKVYDTIYCNSKLFEVYDLLIDVLSRNSYID